MITRFDTQGMPHFLMKNSSISILLRIHCGQVELLHFGIPISESDAEAMAFRQGPGWGTSVLLPETGKEPVCLDAMPLCWSSSGTGDYRESPVELLRQGKPVTPEFTFGKAEIQKGILPMKTLPQASGDCESLKITMKGADCDAILCFSLFDTALTRRTVIQNRIKAPLTVTRCMSTCMDLPGDFTMTTLNGSWIAEAHPYSVQVGAARVVNESSTGFSSNRHNPGFVLCRGGEAFGCNLIYSGNHYASAQKSHQGFTRVMQGISPDNFACTLEAYASFETPEAVLTWSPDGVNGLRQRMHDFVNDHVIPEYFRRRPRPVLYNDWEGCMFDFSEKKLLSLARKAKAAGCELFVLDDGWFGARNSDTAGLGDYDVNRRKLPGGLEGLSRKIHALGLDFGLWFEPEAVNPDSDLYRAHPDWAIHTGTTDLLGRNELLLDLRKPEVRNYIVENVSGILDRANVNYVKWDMNRHSTLLGAEAHEYILGLYDVLRRIFGPRPEVLLESCASGGNRFDLGMLCFGPQAWASDDTDPIERLKIQEGLSLLYPQSAMGSHVSAAPHLQTLRNTPLSTRCNVSFFGIFGLELDLTRLLPVELTELKAAIAYYKAHRETFQFGIFAAYPAGENAVCWTVRGKKETLAGLFHTLIDAAPGYERLTIPGLHPNRSYTVTARPQKLRLNRFAGMVKYIVPLDPSPNGPLVRTADRLYQMDDGGYERICSGAALSAGIALNNLFLGTGYDAQFRNQGDFASNVYWIR